MAECSHCIIFKMCIDTAKDSAGELEQKDSAGEFEHNMPLAPDTSDK